MKKNLILFIVFFVIMIVFNIPYIVHSIFPANLLGCIVGGFGTGVYLAKLFK